MRRRVDAARIEIESDGFRDLAVKGLLRRDRILALQHTLGHVGRFGHSGREQRSNGRAKFGKELAQLRSRGAGFVAFDERIVRRFLESPAIGHLPIQGENLVKVRLEKRKLGLLAGLAPGLAGMGADAFQFFHQTRGYSWWRDHTAAAIRGDCRLQKNP